MVYIIPPVIKEFYDKWNIQVFILISLSLQTFLVFFAPLRKRTRNVIMLSLILLANVLADWAAGFVVGLISSNQDPTPKPEILALWAPFLLLHLGGSDTINAFPLEDNAVWIKHLVGLVVQVIVAVIVFAQSFPNNELWVSTVLVFVAGTVKNFERTIALYKANGVRFRESMLKEPDPGPNYALLMHAYTSQERAGLPTQIELILEPNREWKAARDAMDENELDDLEVVQHAFNFFEIFKGHIVDLIFSFSEREESRQFFLRRNSIDAYRLLAVELNYMYDVLYTKMWVIFSVQGIIFRIIYWCMVMTALVLFHLKDKYDFRKIDVNITYALLYGAIIVDAIALLRLVFSDRTATYIQKLLRGSNWKINLRRWIFFSFRKYLTLKRINWGTATKSTSTTSNMEVFVLDCVGLARKIVFSSFTGVREILFRRWSESLSTFNLIDYCLQERPRMKRTICDRFCRHLLNVTREIGTKNLYDKLKYISNERIEESLWDFIFTQLKKKSSLADDPETGKRIGYAKGDWVLQSNKWYQSSDKLMSYVDGLDFDQSLIIWHVATDLCYKRDEFYNSHYQKISKIISDYLLYLLVIHPTMMFSITGITHIRFRDTCAEAKEFFSLNISEKKDLEKEHEDARKMKDLEKEHEVARKMILAVNTKVKPIDLKGDRSKSVLFDACILAKELEKLKEKKWMLISEVWVELLSYAANQCRGNIHATQLSKGGELITFVWLLMVHLGLGDHFQTNEGNACAKLIVGK